MKLNRGLRLVLGVLTIAPIGYLVLFLSYLFPKLASVLEGPAPQRDQYSTLFHTVVLLHLTAIVLAFAILGFCIVYLFRTDRVPPDKKALWATVLLLGNMLTMPVFWYLYIWREPSITASRASSGEGSRLTCA